MDYRTQRNETVDLWRKAIAECEGIVTTRTVQEFAALVAAEERERWAKKCNETAAILRREPDEKKQISAHMADWLAAELRA